MNRITVFCGSSTGSEQQYKEQAFLLGESLAKQNIGVVYGGASIGLMGTVADGALSKGGEVIGVLPRFFLDGKEVAHENLTELILVDSMHERKTIMNALCDGVITLPGGFGTMEEMFEMLTWAQLGHHKKPIGLLNINGFYDDLITMIQNMVDKNFLKPSYQNMLLVADNIDDLLSLMHQYQAPEITEWVNEKTT